jgi:hypothetical protein
VPVFWCGGDAATYRQIVHTYRYICRTGLYLRNLLLYVENNTMWDYYMLKTILCVNIYFDSCTSLIYGTGQELVLARPASSDHESQIYRRSIITHLRS